MTSPLPVSSSPTVKLTSIDQVIDGADDEIEYIPLCADHYLEFVMNGKYK